MSLALPAERAEAALASGAVAIALEPGGAVLSEDEDDDAYADDDHELATGADVQLQELEDEDARDESALLDALSKATWEVEVADAAQSQWRSRGVDAAIRRDALRKLLRVASGERAARLSKRLTLPSAPRARLYETYLERHWRALWEEVSGPSERGSGLRVCDKLVFWGVYSHDRTQERIRYVEQHIASRPPAPLPAVPRPKAAAAAPAAEVAGRHHRIRLPREFPEGSEGGPRYLSLAALEDDAAVGAAGAEAPPSTLRERARAREADEAVLKRVRDEAVSLAASVLGSAAVAAPPNSNSASAAAAAAAGADPSACAASRPRPRPAAGPPRSQPASDQAARSGEEARAVAAPWPCIVNGRPGAGKTSCAIVRLWAGDRTYWALSRGHRLLSGGRGHYRAAFLAANAALCGRVRATLGRLRRAEEKGRREALFGRGEGAEAAGAGTGAVDDPADPDSDGVGADDAVLEALGAASLRDLREAHFPLCVSRDRWLRLLNATLERPFDFAFERERRVGADRFRGDLWPELCAGRDEAALGGLTADDLWSEIVSHLRGGLDALLSPGGVLALDDYLALGRMQSRVPPEQRRVAFELHARYEQLKRSPRHASGSGGLPLFDHLDVVHHVFGRLREEGYRGPAVHEVYVDEVQDWTMAELALVALFAGDSRALWMSGDSAQAIARGVAFQFRYVRKLLLPETERRLFDRRCTPQDHDPVCYLTQNYRSHAGILALGSTLLDVVAALNPREIDPLPRDVGMRGGELPVFFESSSADDLRRFLFGETGAGTGATVKPGGDRLGAEQVVLVRSREAKERLPEWLRGSQVLTIEESKGLEFDSVLIVDFFRDSDARDDRLWQRAVRAVEAEVVAGAAIKLKVDQEADAKPSIAASDRAEPNSKDQLARLDANKLFVLTHTLKLLYVAATRARENVWVFDRMQEAPKSLAAARKILVGLLANCKAVQDEKCVGSIQRRVVDSSPEIWRRKGKDYEQLGMREAADRAFAIAEELEAALRPNAPEGRPCESSPEAPAMATGEQDRVPASVLSGARAANSDSRLRMLRRAEKSLASAREMSGRREPSARDKFIEAARLFKDAGAAERAAECLSSAGEVVKAIKICNAAGLNDSVWKLLQPHQKPEKWEQAGQFYVQQQDFDRALICFKYVGVEACVDLFIRLMSQDRDRATRLRIRPQGVPGLPISYNASETFAAGVPVAVLTRDQDGVIVEDLIYFCAELLRQRETCDKLASDYGEKWVPVLRSPRERFVMVQLALRLAAMYPPRAVLEHLCAVPSRLGALFDVLASKDSESMLGETIGITGSCAGRIRSVYEGISSIRREAHSSYDNLHKRYQMQQSRKLSTDIVVVPPGVDTLRRAVEAAEPGQTLLLQPGRYVTGTSHGRDQIFIAKSIRILGTHNSIVTRSREVPRQQQLLPDHEFETGPLLQIMGWNPNDSAVTIDISPPHVTLENIRFEIPECAGDKYCALAEIVGPVQADIVGCHFDAHGTIGINISGFDTFFSQPSTWKEQLNGIHDAYGRAGGGQLVRIAGCTFVVRECTHIDEQARDEMNLLPQIIVEKYARVILENNEFVGTGLVIRASAIARVSGNVFNASPCFAIQTAYGCCILVEENVICNSDLGIGFEVFVTTNGKGLYSNSRTYIACGNSIFQCRTGVYVDFQDFSGSPAISPNLQDFWILDPTDSRTHSINMDIERALQQKQRELLSGITVRTEQLCIVERNEIFSASKSLRPPSHPACGMAICVRVQIGRQPGSCRPVSGELERSRPPVIESNAIADYPEGIYVEGPFSMSMCNLESNDELRVALTVPRIASNRLERCQTGIRVVHPLSDDRECFGATEAENSFVDCSTSLIKRLPKIKNSNSK